jgi:hypothetical protein
LCQWSHSLVSCLNDRYPRSESTSRVAALIQQTVTQKQKGKFSAEIARCNFFGQRSIFGYLRAR